MALTAEEKRIVEQAKSEGLTKEQAIARLASSRGASVSTPIEKSPLANRFTEAIGLGGATDVFGRLLARQGVGPQTRAEGQSFVEKPTGLQVAGAVAQTATIPAGFALTGGSSLAGQVAAGAGLGYLYDVGSDLAEGRTGSEVLKPGAETLAGAAVPVALRGISGLVGQVGKVAEKTRGVRQVGRELSERVPRAFDRASDVIETAAQRAERIKTSPPAVGNAIRAGVDDVVIDAIQQADEPTLAAYRRMADIAEQPRTGLRPAVRPSIVTGEAISDQYRILDTSRKNVGRQIGEVVDSLTTKGQSVDVLPEQRVIRDLLRRNGISPDVSGQLDFAGSSLTPKQQTLVQQIYDAATQSERLTPRQVYNYDKLFSQLQREARFDNLDTIYLATEQGDINIFRAFRNVYSNKLDQIAPDIAPLNRQYAQLRNLQDDIESTIVRRGNYASNVTDDPAEFAQTNLRRIFSEAQSAADYRILADKLDEFARANGYAGANPQDLAGFAEKLKEIYPETVPETGLRGSIGSGIKDVIGKVLDAGKPSEADKQKALLELLNSLLEAPK